MLRLLKNWINSWTLLHHSAHSPVFFNMVQWVVSELLKPLPFICATSRKRPILGHLHYYSDLAAFGPGNSGDCKTRHHEFGVLT